MSSSKLHASTISRSRIIAFFIAIAEAYRAESCHGNEGCEETRGRIVTAAHNGCVAVWMRDDVMILESVKTVIRHVVVFGSTGPGLSALDRAGFAGELVRSVLSGGGYEAILGRNTSDA